MNNPMKPEDYIAIGRQYVHNTYPTRVVTVVAIDPAPGRYNGPFVTVDQPGVIPIAYRPGYFVEAFRELLA